MSARRGFQVAELVVAGSVFLLATLPVITLFLERGRAHRQGPDHALALGLAWGVVEQIAAAAADDPRVLEGLARDPVAPPVWPPGDADSPLARELVGLSGKLASRPRGAGTSCAITDLSLTLDWSWGGEERELTLAFALSPTHAARLSCSLPDDAAVRARLYPEEVVPLAQVAARRGARLPQLRALGVLAVVVGALDDARVEGPAPATHPVTAPPGVASAPAPAARSWESARAHEARAAVRLAVLEQLARTLPVLAGVTRPELGQPPPDPQTYRAALDALPHLKPTLLRDLASALEGYERVAGDAGAPPRIRSGSARRAAEIASLSLALGGPPRPGASAVPTASRAPDRASAIVTYDRVMMTTVAHLRALL